MSISIRLCKIEDAGLIHDLRSDPRLKGMQYGVAWWETREYYVEAAISYAKMDQPAFQCWTVLDNGNFVGHVSETIASDVQDQNIVSVGWNIIPERWGEGIAPRAVKLVLQQRFENDDSVEFIAFCFDSNSRSRRVLEKLAFKSEPATFKEKLKNFVKTLGRQNLSKYRLTRESWEATQAPMKR